MRQPPPTSSFSFIYLLLGLGNPNSDGPDFVKVAAIQAITEGKNQYACGRGVLGHRIFGPPRSFRN